MERGLRVKCPVCRKHGHWFDGPSPYGPFCSRRCKLVDLGQWFNEEHTVSRLLTEEDLTHPDLEAEEKPEPHDDRS